MGTILASAGYHLDYFINVGPERAGSISDYLNLSEFAEAHGAQLLRPPTYSMTDARSQEIFADHAIDLVISVGWQRLFPPWFLNRLRLGAYGMHGSAEPLPKGRGRSPMIWSILEGRKQFYTYLFRYDEGVDSGMIVGRQLFDVFPWDTISTLQHKNAVAQAQLLLAHLPALLQGEAALVPQPDDVEPTYYPKRAPEHGVIDWNETAERVDRLVRAVAAPYPGAFSFSDEVRVHIWSGGVFDTNLGFSPAVGEIVHAFHDGTFVVQCRDLPFHVSRWDAPSGWRPRAGLKFESHENPSWQMLDDMRPENGPAHGRFTRGDYGELLSVIKGAGYRFLGFEEDTGENNVVLLRHDIDKDVSAALRMADVEASLGIKATYFFLLRAPLYSLLEPATLAEVQQISSRGHAVALHCDVGRIPGYKEGDDLDAAVLRELRLFEDVHGCEGTRVVSFHNPSRQLIGREPNAHAYVSAYAPRFLLPETKYISDSNAFWREGNPIEMLRSREWGRLQILTHPIWWSSEEPRTRIDVLKSAFEKRVHSIDEYLRSSNDVWRSFHGG